MTLQNCIYNLRCTVADGNVWSSSRLHGKTHNLSFDKDEQQNKHLKKCQELSHGYRFLDVVSQR